MTSSSLPSVYYSQSKSITSSVGDPYPLSTCAWRWWAALITSNHHLIFYNATALVGKLVAEFSGALNVLVRNWSSSFWALSWFSVVSSFRR